MCTDLNDLGLPLNSKVPALVREKRIFQLRPRASNRGVFLNE
jgi:hypothetical protein